MEQEQYSASVKVEDTEEDRMMDAAQENSLMLLRGMNPQVIACDELGTPGDAEAVAQGVASGVVFFATVHCDDPAGLRKKPALAALLDTGAFAKAAFLSGRSRPGAVAQWVTL